MKTTTKQKVSLFAAALLGVLAALAVTAAFSVLKVQGESMEPSIEKGDIIIINKLSYFFHKPRIGDAVAFSCNIYSEDGEGSVLVRRVAALEGDEVEIREGMLYVNGRIYNAYTENPVYMEPMEKTIIGKDKIFILSDNRGALLDSRDPAVGQLKASELLGKVCLK